MTDKVYSVSDINGFIKGVLEHVPQLGAVQVLGEISNFKRYPSGHCYFTLKDGAAALKCVMFAGKARYLRFQPVNGNKVVASGRISVYERDGVYQLNVDALSLDGAGALLEAYEKLKAKLAAEGLFDQTRKKPLPLLPKSVGIVTSSAGAAVHDVITVSRRRDPGVKLYLYPVKVQGDGAAEEIVSAIRFFNEVHPVDVLIVGRGGGSIEDLWAFNEEPVVRAVAASRIPVVSAVGHETDFTLCDFAADRRAATPSQAAEIVAPDVEAYKNGIAALVAHGRDVLEKRFAEERRKLSAIDGSWVFRHPERLFEEQAQRLDRAMQGLQKGIESAQREKVQHFSLVAAKLDALSPLSILGRGYSITQTRDLRVVKSVDAVVIGDPIMTHLQDGDLVSVVQEVRRKSNGTDS